MPRVLKYCEIHLLKEKLLSYVENIVHEIMFCMFWIAWQLCLFGQLKEIQNNFILVRSY